MRSLEHFSTLTLVFDQGTDSTNLRLTWNGVPVGQDEVTKRNFEDYYVRSIKTTFGYGVPFPSRVSSSPFPRGKKARDKKSPRKAVVKESTWQEKLEIAAPALSVAVLVAGLAYVVSVYGG